MEKQPTLSIEQQIKNLELANYALKNYIRLLENKLERCKRLLAHATRSREERTSSALRQRHVSPFARPHHSDSHLLDDYDVEEDDLYDCDDDIDVEEDDLYDCDDDFDEDSEDYDDYDDDCDEYEEFEGYEI